MGFWIVDNLIVINLLKCILLLGLLVYLDSLDFVFEKDVDWMYVRDNVKIVMD